MTISTDHPLRHLHYGMTALLVTVVSSLCKTVEAYDYYSMHFSLDDSRNTTTNAHVVTACIGQEHPLTAQAKILLGTLQDALIKQCHVSDGFRTSFKYGIGHCSAYHTGSKNTSAYEQAKERFTLDLSPGLHVGPRSPYYIEGVNCTLDALSSAGFFPASSPTPPGPTVETAKPLSSTPMIIVLTLLSGLTVLALACFATYKSRAYCSNAGRVSRPEAPHEGTRLTKVSADGYGTSVNSVTAEFTSQAGSPS